MDRDNRSSFIAKCSETRRPIAAAPCRAGAFILEATPSAGAAGKAGISASPRAADLTVNGPVAPQSYSSQTCDNYCIILKDDGLEIEVGSIGIQHVASATEYLAWGIDTAIPMREVEAQDRLASKAVSAEQNCALLRGDRSLRAPGALARGLRLRKHPTKPSSKLQGSCKCQRDRIGCLYGFTLSS